ncbi:sigma-70 family RNA polymerase sigma factor [Clostridium perfringens]|uniref:Putative DNA-dependent RNA polymerase sigma subunit n=1 Tax=Clostridium perfringens E str. JGS1987 TaxID=451755 RepID=B1BY50_CLOPF|nr:sigma-70 family RNA polymerase sigma factor [Clostridium perfringens]EDT13365.1 putative DNA-dependent RNA polymerase sigma subunit [Clostridium perfringens E str. JGS1987]
MTNEEIFITYKNGDKKALNKLIEKNNGLIYKIINKYIGVKRAEEEDLYQSGVLGFIKGLNHYDINKNNKAKLSTYVTYWIEREVYSLVNGRTTKDIENKELMNNCISLNTPIDEEGAELLEVIEGVDYIFENTIEKEFFKKIRIELDEVMEKYLNEEEKVVLHYHFGWFGTTYTDVQLGNLLSVTNTRIGHIRTTALMRIRRTKWAFKNRKTFEELGYISKHYLRIIYHG